MVKTFQSHESLGADFSHPLLSSRLRNCFRARVSAGFALSSRADPTPFCRDLFSLRPSVWDIRPFHSSEAARPTLFTPFLFLICVTLFPSSFTLCRRLLSAHLIFDQPNPKILIVKFAVHDSMFAFRYALFGFRIMMVALDFRIPSFVNSPPRRFCVDGVTSISCFRNRFESVQCLIDLVPSPLLGKIGSPRAR